MKLGEGGERKIFRKPQHVLLHCFGLINQLFLGGEWDLLLLRLKQRPRGNKRREKG